MDGHVVGAVAGEAVKLMHDAERDAGRGDERQHLLQPVTIRALNSWAFRAFASLCAGIENPSSVLPRLGLLPRGDPQVRDGQQVGCFGGVIGGLGVEGGSPHDVLLI